MIKNLILLALGMALLTGIVRAETQPSDKADRDNLMVVLRGSSNSNWTEEQLRPFGKMKAQLGDGKEVEIEMAWFGFLGDMHIRFVFDSPQSLRNAQPSDLARLGITPEQALEIAIQNIERVYGKPKSVPWTDGLMLVQGESPDLDSSYFLDRSFWLDLLKQHPEGLVVAVAKRGGLLYVPLSDTKTVDGLRKGISYLYESSGNLRLSSALYLFKDGKWSVFQSPSTR